MYCPIKHTFILTTIHITLVQMKMNFPPYSIRHNAKNRKLTMQIQNILHIKIFSGKFESIALQIG